jgi:glycosyltransferase involved in cell wall biosynthesis
MTPKISAIIITKNEILNIEACLTSLLGFVDEVIIVDSQSSDGTV